LLKVPPIKVVGAHEVAIRFPARMPYGRGLRVKVEADGVELKSGESAAYDVLLPDFVVDAEVDGATLVIADSGEGLAATFNGAKGVVGDCGAECARLKLAGEGMKVARADGVKSSGEVVVQVAATGGAVRLFGKAEGQGEGVGHADPVLVVHTKAMLKEPVGYTVAEWAGFGLPKMTPLLDYSMRDTSIRMGGDGNYYMVGTTGAPDWWTVTADLKMWRSVDLQTWTPVVTEPRVQTTVWNIDRQGTWQKKMTLRDGQDFRPLWAPEIHYLKGTYWIPYSIPRLGTGILKSTTGKPEGPYESAIKPDGPLTDGIDASLFQDDDGTVYFLWGGNNIAKMKDDLSGLAEAPRKIGPANEPFVGFEGISLIKANGKYYLSGADFVFSEYHCFTASADSIYGPYSDRYVSVPHGGHNNFFKDRDGRWWSTFFGNDLQAPFKELPGIVPMRFDEKGRLRPDIAGR
jgi:hypothetical protein